MPRSLSLLPPRRRVTSHHQTAIPAMTNAAPPPSAVEKPRRMSCCVWVVYVAALRGPRVARETKRELKRLRRELASSSSARRAKAVKVTTGTKLQAQEDEQLGQGKEGALLAPLQAARAKYVRRKQRHGNRESDVRQAGGAITTARLVLIYGWGVAACRRSLNLLRSRTSSEQR